MARIHGDRIKETTSTTGTGNIQLAGATSNFRSFVTALGNGSRTECCVTDNAGNWEILDVTIVSGSPNSLTVNGVIASSTGSKINWGAGVKDVIGFRSHSRAVAFKATKSGVQSILSATNTVLTWATEAWDIGSHFDTGTGRWTPPAGRVRLTLRVGILNFTPTSPNTFYAYIYKNGASAAWHRNRLDVNLTLNLSTVILEDEAIGTDYYDARVFGDSAFDVTGEVNMTAFMGAMIHA